MWFAEVCGGFDGGSRKLGGSFDWMVSREPFNIGSVRAVITVLYQAKGIAKVNVDRCDISSNKEIMIVI